MIIKAGTYRFNDNIDKFIGEFSLPIRVQGSINEESVTFDLEAVSEFSKIVVETYVEGYWYLTYHTDTGSRQFYKSNEWYWDYWYYFGLQHGVDFGENIKGWGQTITVIVDTEVDDSNGTWFTSNTTMLIKAGTYKWSDRPNLYAKSIRHGSNFFDLPISTPEISVEGITIGSWAGLNINISTAFIDASYGTIFLSNGTESIEVPIYADIPIEDVGTPYWSFAYLGTGGLLPENYGQIFTVISDYYVPTDFGLWANSNWQPYVEPTPTENITINLTYKGTPFLTITNGEVTTPTTSATSVEIPTKDYSFTENIKIEITKS